MREQQTLGRRIQEARQAAGLSQESLGEPVSYTHLTLPTILRV